MGKKKRQVELEILLPDTDVFSIKPRNPVTVEFNDGIESVIVEANTEFELVGQLMINKINVKTDKANRIEMYIGRALEGEGSGQDDK